jgi:hypothetical protein
MGNDERPATPLRPISVRLPIDDGRCCDTYHNGLVTVSRVGMRGRKDDREMLAATSSLPA